MNLVTIVKKYSLQVSAFYPTDCSKQNDGFSCGPFVCIHAFNASVLSSKCLSKVTWTIKFNDLMENSLTVNHTVYDIRIEIHNFCLLIKRFSNDSNTKDNKFKDQSLIPYNNLKSVDEISSESYFYDSIPISKFETSFLKFVTETKEEKYQTEPTHHEKNCKIIFETYQKLNKYFKTPDIYCTFSEWYLKYIVSELTIQYLIFYDKNGKGEKLDVAHQFPDWTC